jgi:hypothetical protein
VDEAHETATEILHRNAKESSPIRSATILSAIGVLVTAVATHALAAGRGGSGIGTGSEFQNNRAAREVINEKQLRGHLARIEGAQKEGARELLGGVPDRQVLPPHVFAGVTNPLKFPVVSQEQQS